MTQKELAVAARRILLQGDVAELTVGRIAERLNVSLPNLSRAYSNYFGYPLKMDLEARRIKEFNMLMIKGKARTVKEALEILDIWSASHFIKRYKRWVGITPGRLYNNYWGRRKP